MILIDYIMHLYLKITKRRIDYDLYMTTSHWKRMKNKALKRCGNKCMFCGTYMGTLILHHNSYRNLFFEKKSDVVILCKSCHNTLHYYRWKPKKNREVS